MINYYKKKGEKGQIPKEEGNKEDVNMINIDKDYKCINRKKIKRSKNYQRMNK